MTESFPENALLSEWEKTLARLADQPAIVLPSGETARTFSQIEQESRALSEPLAPFAPGAVIGVQIGNSPSWPALLLALFRSGLVPLPLGRHMETAELNQALETCGVTALITASGDDLRINRQQATSNQQSPPADFLKLTSGTTSAPRAVRFQAHQLLADCENICATMGLTGRDLNFGVIPFSHSYGFSNLITPLLARGVPLVASEDRMPRAILDGLAASGATVFPGMPVFFEKFAELEKLPRLPRLRLCISAGAPLPKSVGERFTQKFGLKIHTFYGASECGGIGYDASDAPIYEDEFVGARMRGVEIERVERDAVGPIAVRGPAVGDGYWPEPDEEALGHGRFVPSDLVRWTERGMFIAGRVSDVINIAGRKLNPLEIEKRLLECPGVKKAIVFGVPSALRGEEPVACIIAEPGTTAADVMRFCHARLSPWQTPKNAWLVDELPINERGKLSRRALAERYRSIMEDEN